MAVATVKVKLSLDKVTKRTHRYAEVENSAQLEAVLPTVYVKTEALKKVFGEVPEEIEITINELSTKSS
ncbi:MAG: hypothetical protein WC992_05665 [Acholeplasmataceae bacterium]